jgi:hypothetical protein
LDTLLARLIGLQERGIVVRYEGDPPEEGATEWLILDEDSDEEEEDGTA